MALLVLGWALAAGKAEEGPAWDVGAPHGPGADASFTVAEGTWLGVDVSPMGGSVLFDLLGDLFVVPLQGGPARRLTTGVAWDTDARFSPDGSKILFSSDRGGNEELWEMDADGTDARQLTESEDARWTDGVYAPEPGWFLGRKRTVDTRSIGVQELWLLHREGGKGVKLTTVEQDPHAGEAQFSKDGRYVYFSTRSRRFDYDDDPHNGLWQIARYDRVLDERVTVTDLQEGAARPAISPDGRTMAFVTRDRTRTLLVAMDLATGQVRRLADGLDWDQFEGFELRGTYPRIDWTPDGRELVLWAGGKLWRIDAASGARTQIPFTARIDTRLAAAVHPPRRLEDGPVRAREIRWPVIAPSGAVYASALGRTWLLPPGLPAREIGPLGQTTYFPSLSPDGSQVALVTWDDASFGQVWAGPPTALRQVTRSPAHYEAPAWSPDGRTLLALRGSGGYARGHDLGQVAYYDLVTIPAAGGDATRLRTVPFRGSNSRSPRPQFSPDGTRIYWLEDVPPTDRVAETAALVSCNLEGTDHRQHVIFPAGAQEARLSPDGRWLAYRSEHQAWIAPMPGLGNAKVSVANLPARRLTDVAGGWLDWHGADVTFAHGDQLYEVPLAGVLAKDAEQVPASRSRTLEISAPREVGRGTLAFINARIVTMDDAGVIERGTLVIRDRRIVAVGPDVLPPPGADVINLQGRTVLPGLVDVHAHLHYASGDVFPEQEWRHLANLAYGVTTVFDPSASSDLVFGQAELIEAGRMLGPRTYSTGFILYGALDTQGAKVGSYQDAENHVKRLARLGALGVKSYQQPQRRQRQWIVEACRKLGLLDVPEGGGDLFANLGMVIDGHSSIEHSLPMAPLYDDVVQLWSRSGTTYVPTLIVAYGGAFGEMEQYQRERVYDDPRLRKWTPLEVLQARAYRLSPYITDEAEFHHRAVAQQAAKLQRAGVNVALGAHGQLQGLGAHWELELLGGPGAMTPYRALQAATIAGARHLGLDQDLGSIRAGKVADLFVVDGDPLLDLRAARSVVYVAKDGIVYDAAGNMDTAWPSPRQRPPMTWELTTPR